MTTAAERDPLAGAAPWADRLLMKLRQRDDVDAEEEAALRSIIGPPQPYPARRMVIEEGEPLERSALLVEGLILLGVGVVANQLRGRIGRGAGGHDAGAPQPVAGG